MNTSESKPRTPSLPLLRVLVLEDNPRDAKLTKSVLERQGYELQYAVTDSQQDYQERLEKAEYDLILADFNLGNWTAFDALEILKRSGKDIPLILLTGTVGDEVAVECIKQGAADYVLKDRAARLAVCIHRALEEKRLRVENVRAFEAASRLATIVEFSGDAIIGTTANRIITSWNKGAERLYGHSAAEMLGQSLDTLVPPERSNELQEIYENLRQGQSIERLETVRVGSDGGRVDVSLSIFPLSGSKGELRGYASIARDIRERKRAEKALRESEERFRRIAETIAEVFWTADPGTGKLLYVSPAYEQVWGRSVASLHEDPRSFLKAIHPEDTERVLEHLEGQRKGLRIDHEYRILRPDGTTRWIWDRGFPVRDEGGRIICYVGAAQDITERKETEAEHVRLVTAIEQSTESVVITDTRGIIEYVNPAFTRITGYSREEALGQTPRILKSGKQDKAFYETLWGTILEGKSWHGELINRRKDGSFYNEEMNVAPIRNERGEVTHFIATKQDVTRRRQIEHQLRQAQRVEAIGRLAGGVAHDFNNLLTIISGYGQLLRERLGPVEIGLLEEILKASDRAASLTRQLLAFSRQQLLTPQVLDLNAVVANVEKMLRRLIGEDIELATNLAPDLGRVKADPGQVEQVIMNLVVNSRDAMPDGGKVTVETANVELDENYALTHAGSRPGPYVMLSVIDTGIGMDAETQSHIFEPFFTTKEIGAGTGLGLATVYGVVKQSGGYIWVLSEPGHGATFKIYLPKIEDGVGNIESGALSSPLAGGSETILVAEDEEGVRSLVCQTLRSLGYKVLEVRDPYHAVALMEQRAEPIHLLLTDLVMPRMSGKELARHMSAAHPKSKVLYMSGYTDDAVVRHGLLHAGVWFLQKPFTPAALARKVREVLQTGGEERR